MAPLLTPNADHTVRDRESTLRLARYQNTCCYCYCFWSRLPSLNRLFYCYILSPAAVRRRHCHVVPLAPPPCLATDSTRSSWLSNSWFTVLRTRINVLVPSYSLLVLSLAHAEIALSVKVGQRNQLCWERCPHRTSPLPFFFGMFAVKEPRGTLSFCQQRYLTKWIQVQ